jgi:hypothetical protein
MTIMLKKVIVVVAIITSILFTGCASVRMASKEADLALKNFAQPPSDKAGLYIYRNSWIGQALKKDIYLDSVLIGETANKVYFYKLISPGQHTLSTESEFGENGITFQADSGKNHFAEQYIKFGVFVGGAGIEMVDEEVGMKEVLDCSLAEPL